MSRHYGATSATPEERVARWAVIASWIVLLAYLATVVDQRMMDAAGKHVGNGSVFEMIFGMVGLILWLTTMYSLLAVVIAGGIVVVILARQGRWSGPRTSGFWWSIGPALVAVIALVLQAVSGTLIVF